MTRRWLALGISVIIVGFLADAVMAPTEGEPIRRTSRVEVVNFPNPQSIEGAVSVANFPGTQAVVGEVNIGNLPAVQTVSGDVSVANLPLDADGNLRVASAPLAPEIRFAGYTTASFAEGTGLLALNRACEAEFAGTRVCSGSELVEMIPAPPEVVPNQGGDPSLPGYAFLVRFEQTYGSGLGIESGARIPFSSCMSARGVPFDCGGLPMVVACCGF